MKNCSESEKRSDANIQPLPNVLDLKNERKNESRGRAAGAYARWMISGEPAALQAIQDASDWLAPNGITLFRSLNHGWLAEGFARSGRTEAARQHAAGALQRLRAHDLMGGAMACRAMARLSAEQANPLATERWLARADRVARRRGAAHELASNRLCEAQVMATHGDAARATPLLHAAQAEFARLGMAWHQAEAEALAQRISTISR